MKLYARFIKVVLVVIVCGSAQAQDSFFEPDLIEIIPQGDSVSRYFVAVSLCSKRLCPYNVRSFFIK